jgi:hypothetical protein
VLTGLGFAIAGFNAAIRIMFAMGREQVLPGSLARLSGRHTPVIAIGCVAAFTLALGLPLTYAYGAHAFAYLIGAAALSVVLIYLAVNIAAIRAFRTEFRDQFSLWRHLLIPAAATVLLLFPLWGILHPRAYTLVNLLPFVALGWLCLGAVVAGVFRARGRQASRPWARYSCLAKDNPALASIVVEPERRTSVIRPQGSDLIFDHPYNAESERVGRWLEVVAWRPDSARFPILCVLSPCQLTAHNWLRPYTRSASLTASL